MFQSTPTCKGLDSVPPKVILQLRLYAMYYLEKNVLRAMFAVFIAAVVASSTMMGISLQGVTGKLSRIVVNASISLVKSLSASSNIPLTHIKFCLPLKHPKFFYSFWIPILASESFLCCLAVWRGYQSYRHQRSSFRASQNLIDILIRDSILYFLMYVPYSGGFLFPGDQHDPAIGCSVFISVTRSFSSLGV